ncbi:hypothetical protein BWK62_12235 [Flavobacterium oreochromis]|uniref:DUF4249 domain-containing protein n=1 Tax=Flavobacterium columnare TaxID=996 RepID=A0A246G8L8_9FLAO|nr:hypothetical protein BWG23_12450 [Flavobacterium oreochromis]OWP75323.1 hypothetical protein BWK62_12235 [Flavobacterium oreochromis]POR21295.1 hypothetical protein BWK58_12610 [Flavobacterium columnare]
MVRVIICFFLISCQEEKNVTNAPMKIVVEGSIEEKEPAFVVLSKSIPINVNLNLNTIDQYFIRAAKVTVSTDDKQEILRLKMMPGYYPPFVYVGEEILGQIGKKYHLKVEYKGQIITAETIIPKTVLIQTLDFQKIDENKGKLVIGFTDDLDKNYYQITTRIRGKDSLFVPTLYGNIDDNSLKGEKVSLNILKGIKFFPEKDTDTNFPIDKIIEVKLKNMNKETYEFWNSWQNDVLNGQNPLFPSVFNLKTNIKGGFGIWAGYGSDLKLIRAK